MVERTPISIRKQKKDLKRTLKETQPIVQMKTAVASRREIEQCGRDSARIVQLMCDVDVDTTGQVMLLLENSEQLGV